MEKRIALIEGDGIGPEILAEAMKVLRCIEERYGHHFTYVPVCAGGCAIDRYGTSLPKESLEACLDSDSVLLAAVGELIAAYDRAKQQANLQTFDDMIRDVHRALMEPGSRLQRSLEQQYPLGIVDEFQDTDPIQYAIF